MAPAQDKFFGCTHIGNMVMTWVYINGRDFSFLCQSLYILILSIENVHKLDNAADI